MHTLSFTTTINAPTSKVRDMMINHPTYEQWTTAFSEGSTYTGSWETGADIKFGDTEGYGMISKIADNRLYEYISIQHLGEIGENHITKMYDSGEIFENYSFTKIDEVTTKLDIELASLPEEYSEMFSQMWPKALEILKEICEK